MEMLDDIKYIWKHVVLFLVGFAFGIIACLQFQAMSRTADMRSGHECGLKWKQEHFRLNEANLRDELVAQGCPNIQKAYDDAMAGSDSLRSSSCTVMNNVFGLCGTDGKYLVFEHWTESVTEYIKQCCP